jgi:hypothetical protein
MSEQNLGLEAFSKFIVALEPWLGEAVLIGGWAHRLYRLDPRARKLDSARRSVRIRTDYAVSVIATQSDRIIRSRTTIPIGRSRRANSDGEVIFIVESVGISRTAAVLSHVADCIA